MSIDNILKKLIGKNKEVGDRTFDLKFSFPKPDKKLNFNLLDNKYIFECISVVREQ